jgi:hypothetical protein
MGFGDRGGTAKFSNANSGANQGVASGEVIDVVRDPSHKWYMSKTAGADIGYVKVRFLGELANYSKNEDMFGQWIPPLNKNITTFPLKGEIVVLLRAASLAAQENPKDTQWYWLSVVQLWGDINSNAVSNIGFHQDSYVNDKLGDSFKEKDISPMQHYEGDTIFQGRFDNSIRLGSTNSGKPANTWSIGSSAGDPIMFISNGHAKTGDTHIEDINNNASSIILTKSQKIDLKPANAIASQKVAVPTGPATPMTPINGYTSSQIIINSDRLVFNSKKDNIILSAKKEIGLSTATWKLNVSALADILLETLTQLSQEVHPTACGLSGPAVQAPIYAMLKTQMELMKQ